MKRRDFFKYSFSGILGILLCPGKLFGSGWSGTQPATSKEFRYLKEEYPFVSVEFNWKFYINGKEVDSGEAIGLDGSISWPFQGSQEGDLCMAESPFIKIGNM